MSELAPHPIFVSGPLLGPGLFDRQLESFEGASLLESLGTDEPIPTAEWLGEQIGRMARPRAVIAHGLAASAAVEVAVSRPNDVDGLVLVGLGATTAAPVGDDGVIEGLVAGAFTDPASPEAERARRGLVALPDPILGEAVDAWLALELSDRLQGLDVPLLLIAAGKDRLAPLSGAEALASQLAGAGLAVLPDASHGAPAEAPGAIDLLVAAFLARLELALAEEGL